MRKKVFGLVRKSCILIVVTNSSLCLNKTQVNLLAWKLMKAEICSGLHCIIYTIFRNIISIYTKKKFPSSFKFFRCTLFLPFSENCSSFLLLEVSGYLMTYSFNMNYMIYSAGLASSECNWGSSYRPWPYCCHTGYWDNLFPCLLHLYLIV